MDYGMEDMDGYGQEMGDDMGDMMDYGEEDQQQVRFTISNIIINA